MAVSRQGGIANPTPTAVTQNVPVRNGQKPNSPFQGDKWPTPDPSLVVAPYPTPNLSSDNFWDKLYKRWLTLFDDKNTTQPTWVPGISRRNRERREKYEAEMRRWRD